MDDPYIHASIARNLLRAGSYGISPGIFAAASSSIVWPVLLAALFAVFGVHLFLALACNAVLSVLVLAALHGVWGSLTRLAEPAVEFCILALVVLAGPLVLLTFVGMEHTLQVSSVICLFFFAVRAAGQPAGSAVSRGSRQEYAVARCWRCWSGMRAPLPSR